MVACLAALPNLGCLYIGEFLSGPLQITPPRTRIVLPALTRLYFSGLGEYFEDFVAQIDTPLLNILDVFLVEDSLFNFPQLRHFIGRAERLEPLDQAVMVLKDRATSISDAEDGWPHRVQVSNSRRPAILGNVHVFDGATCLSFLMLKSSKSSNTLGKI
jgi:hypothetical protein